ncbi:MAG: TIGR00730 family Rossman fold protein [Bacteroidetes bacterium]|nr:TIGR00730 family Rossman fold protein [Bacteroidota bacterium]MBI3481818.1 TIGR00730 family Rossman fold protein [Bacteroidota bacterium]
MNICVFCGSSSGTDPIYAKAAKELGQLISKSESSLVYGGGNIGLMGILADEVLASKGKVIGVIPDFLMKREVGHSGITQLEIVGSMHERKKRMAEIADVFLAIPGGWGTLDELAEILTWKQLRLIDQPIGLLNIDFFFDSLIEQMKIMVAKGFLAESSFKSIKISDNPQKLLTLLGVKSF